MRRGPTTSTVTVLVSISVTTRFFESLRISSPTSSTLTPLKVVLDSSVSTLVTYTHIARDASSDTIIQNALLL